MLAGRHLACLESDSRTADRCYGQSAPSIWTQGSTRCYAWWDGPDLMVRWSRPDGEWLRPCVLAAGVKRPLFGQPRRAARGEPTRRCARGVGSQRRAAAVGPLQARRAGVDEAGELTRADSPRVTYTVALGDRGHAAIAWTHAQRPPAAYRADLTHALTYVCGRPSPSATQETCRGAGVRSCRVASRARPGARVRGSGRCRSRSGSPTRAPWRTRPRRGTNVRADSYAGTSTIDRWSRVASTTTRSP